MKMLLCNDDGIHAPGIRALRDAVEPLGETHVCAPAAERSATGHAITIFDPIRVQPVEKEGRPFGLAVDGTPADCVKLAVSFLHKDSPPDLVLSGINLGANTGVSVLYSGTVSAASEAAILGLPAIAFSLCAFENPLWETAGKVAADITRKVAENPPPNDVVLNVNIPNLPYERLKGVRVCGMGRSRFIEEFSEHQDPRGNRYYWLDGEMVLLDDDVNTDVRAIEAGYVALTPIRIDLTAREHLQSLAAWNEDF